MKRLIDKILNKKMESTKLKVNVGDKVFILSINGKHFLQVFKSFSGNNPSSPQDFPLEIQNNIVDFSIFIEAVSQVEIGFSPTEDDGLYDNFGNIYAPISDFQ